jgi:hypothetical protein
MSDELMARFKVVRDAYAAEYVVPDGLEVMDDMAARLAEVERERDRMEAEAVVAMDRWHQSQARAERLEAALLRWIKTDNGCLLRNGQHHVRMRPVDYDPCEGLHCGCRKELEAALQQEGGE